MPADSRPDVLQVSRGELSRTLAGLELPAVAAPGCGLRFTPAAGSQAILVARGKSGTNAVLVRTQSKTGEVFFSPQMRLFDRSWAGKPVNLQSAFSSLAPFLLFMTRVAGDYGWHLDGHYANLTIDDAWLRQPYGHLDYAALLREMEKHNFHTTIAFVPWNYDRSEPAVATLLRTNAERFSVCLHGNDHAHREFGDYVSNPLERQIADLKQGVARMERFHALTGVPYDRFMVFPHGVAPEPTFAALRSFGFSGTANSSNIPLDARFPADPTFLLRPYTAAYANFVSYQRYPAAMKIPSAEIAALAFLGNPLLFYGHEDLFDEGIGAFDGLADFVNRMLPDTRWVSLGELARHSHLLRRRADGATDVRMLSNQMDLRNPEAHDTTFFVTRNENHADAIKTLTVDSKPVAFDDSAATLSFRLVIPAGRTARVRVEYRNNWDPSREDIRKRDIYSYVLRRISDFRDLYLSRSSWGRSIKVAYYGHGWNSVEVYLERKWWAGIAVMALAIFGLRQHRSRGRKGTAENVGTN